jgi:signal transduction histidine kinase
LATLFSPTGTKFSNPGLLQSISTQTFRLRTILPIHNFSIISRSCVRLLKQPDAKEIKREAKQDARAHGWKRWRQGYKLEELIREVCLIRRNFIDTWLKVFAVEERRFDFDAQSAARRVVECFFDNLIVEATVQFVEERQEAVRQLNAGLDPSVHSNAEFVQRITHVLREPLGPLLLGLEVLLREESLSSRGVEMIGLLQRGVKKEADAIEELLRSTELFEKTRLDK